jgi:hypothetical protein
LSGLADDDHLQYSLAGASYEFVSTSVTITGTPRTLIVLDAVTLTFDATVPETWNGRVWRIINVGAGALTLDAGSSGLLFNSIEQTISLAPYHQLEVSAAEIEGVGPLFGLISRSPVAAAGGALGSMDIIGGAGISVVAAGDATSVTISAGPPSAHAATHSATGSDALTPAAIGAVATSRQVSAGSGLSGGGDLSADRTFSVVYGSSAGTAAEGNDARLSDSRSPTSHAASHSLSGSDQIAIAASQVVSGVFATSRLASAGIASASTYLRGDQTYAHVNPAPAFLTVSGNKDYGVPGWLPTASPGTSALSTGRLTFEPWWVWREVTIDRLAVEVTTAAASGSLMRLGIYNCDTSWTPTSLVVDAGTIAVDPGAVPAFQTVTVNVTLAPGRYMACWVTQSSPTARTHAGTVPTWPSRIGTASASGNNVYRNSMYLSGQSALVTGGLASTGTAPDVINAGASQNYNYVVLARFS